MKTIIVKTFALMTVLALLLTGCAATTTTTEPTAAPTQEATAAPETAAPAEEPQEDTADDLAGEIMITGSTSAEPLVTVLSDLFMEAHPDVSIAVQGNGSSAGIKAAADGTAQLGMSSRDLKDEEKDGLTPTTICMDGIAVIVNLENPVKALTKDQIAAIFQGEITNWKDVGGNDEEILIISREAGSGTRSAFEEIVGLLAKDENGNEVTLVDESRALIADSTNAVSTTVAGKANSIGYISLGSYDETLVHAIDVDEVACSQENVLGGTYAIARPFVLVAGPGTEQIANAFLDYVMSAEGQAVIAENKYIPVK